MASVHGGHVRTWHDKHEETMRRGDRIADGMTRFIGSWKFVILSNLFVLAWVCVNILALFVWKWDPYPFILLNLVFSWAAFNSTPLILMSGNRASDRDRIQAQADYFTNLEAKEEIEDVMARLNELDQTKLDLLVGKADKILEAVKKAKNPRG